MIRAFIGYDAREAQGFHVFVESLIRTSSEPVSIIPLHGKQGDGSNAFTYARFLIPSLCNFQGTAIFLDGSDMLMRWDIAELVALADPRYAVQVVQHDYQTKHPRKYIGTAMEAPNADYPRKNWSSVVIWNCGHTAHAWMEPKIVHEMSGAFLHRFSWLHDDQIGWLPPAWNVLIGEETREAKIAHFTLGIPAIPEYADVAYSDEWNKMLHYAAQVPERIKEPAYH